MLPTNPFRVAAMLVAVLIWVGCSDKVPATDASGDFGMRPKDSGLPPGDTGLPPGDTGLPSGDTGLSGEDASSSLGRAYPLGLSAIRVADFADARRLGASTVQVEALSTASELHGALVAAKSEGLTLAGRGPGRSKLQDSVTLQVDLSKVTSHLEEMFPDTTVSADSGFLYYYLIDEPCHEGKWSFTGDQMRALYATVKAAAPDLALLVNFGNLECLARFIPTDCSDWHVTDWASFVVTTKKLNEAPNYIAAQMAIAAQVSACDPDLKILSMVAAYEYPAKSVAIPSFGWLQQVGLHLLEYDNLAGLMFFPWRPSSYMGDTIEDVADDGDYQLAFEKVFAEASSVFETR